MAMPARSVFQPPSISRREEISRRPRSSHGSGPKNQPWTEPARNQTPISAVAATRRMTIVRSEEHTSELQSLMRISYAVFCLKKKKDKYTQRPMTVLKPQSHNKSTTRSHANQITNTHH